MSGARTYIHRNMQQAEDLSLPVDGHADVALGCCLRMSAANGSSPRYEMRAAQPQSPAFVRRQSRFGRPAAPGGDVFEHIARLTIDVKRSSRCGKQLRAGIL